MITRNLMQQRGGLGSRAQDILKGVGELTMQKPSPIQTVQMGQPLQVEPIGPAGSGGLPQRSVPVQMPAQPVMESTEPTLSTDMMLPKLKAAAQMKQMVDADPAIEQDPSFQDRAKRFFGSRENMYRLAMAFNTMRLNPDQGLASFLGDELKDIRAQKRTTQGAERAAQILRTKNPELAQMVEQGAIDAKTALQLAYKSPSQLNQMIDLMRTDPEMFRRLASAGAFGGDVDAGQGKLFDEMAKNVISRRDAMIEGGTVAGDLSRQLTRFQMQAEGLETGPLEARMQALREFGASIGIPVDENALASGQSLKAASLNLVANELRKNKGPQTDFDAEFTASFVPSLGNTTAANNEILNYMQSANRIMTIYGGMASEMPYDTREADTFVTKLQREQMNTPAVTKFNGEWITFNEYYREAKGRDRSMSDMQILEMWRKDHEEMGEL